MLNWKAAAYLRLSKDDNENKESNSIINQKDMIEQCVSNNKSLEFVGASAPYRYLKDQKKIIIKREVINGKFDI